MPAVVLIDTNVWISALIHPRGYPAQVVDAWIDGHCDVVISIPLLQELVEVMHRPRIMKRHHLHEADMRRFVDLVSEQATKVTLRGDLRVCRDPDDDAVLETALLGHARFLVTRDDDLKADSDLVTQMVARGVRVLSVQQFLTMLVTEES